SHGCLALLGTVTRASLFAIIDAQRVTTAANHLISNARQIANTTPANEHDRVLLQVVTFAGNVNRDLFAVAQPHAGDLPQRRVRLFGGHRADLQADTLLLGAAVQHGRLADLAGLLASLADELIDSGHWLRIALGRWA